MTFPIIRYPLDPTGLSPNNRVQGEEHVLGPKAGPYHPIAPYYGPFFDNDLTLKVYCNNVLQTREQDWFVQNLVLTPSRDFSGDVSELILMKNKNEGDVIHITYQALGGPFQNNMSTLVDLYNAYLVDNRPVDWARVSNKPNEFPPAYHLHMLRDVIGWEPIIVAIERLINTLTLQGIPAFEALIDWVMARTMEIVTEQEIRNMTLTDKTVSFKRLMYAMKTLHFNSMTAVPRKGTMVRGETFTVDIKSTNLPDAQRLYWTIKHESSEPRFFASNNGPVGMEYQEGSIRIPTNVIANIDGVREFRVEIRRESLNGPVICISRPMYLVYSYDWDFDYGMLVNGVWAIPSTLNTVLVEPHAVSHNLIVDDHFYEISHG